MPEWGSPVIAPEPTSGRTVRPHTPVVKQWAVALLALIAPILVVLYWLTVPDGDWLPVLVTHLTLTLLAALGVVAYSLVAVSAAPTGIRRRNALGRTLVIPASEIAELVRADLSRGTADAHPRLFVIGVDGRLLTRLNGAWWPEGAISALTDALGLPVTVIAEPLSLHEFDRTHPGLLHGYEVRLFAATDDDDVVTAP